MEDRRVSYIMYNLIIFFCVYLIPLIILIATNTTIYVGLQRMKNKITHGAKADFSQKRIEMERRILKSKKNIPIRYSSLNFLLQVSSSLSVVLSSLGHPMPSSSSSLYSVVKAQIFLHLHPSFALVWRKHR